MLPFAKEVYLQLFLFYGPQELHSSRSLILLLSISYSTGNLNVRSMKYENTGKCLNGNGKSNCGQSCKVKAFQSF